MVRVRLPLYSLALFAFTSSGCLPDGSDSPEPDTTGNRVSNQAALSTGVVAYSYSGVVNGSTDVQFVTVRNNGPDAYTGVRISYFFTGQAGKTPTVYKYRTEDCAVGIGNLGGSLYRLVLDCPNAVLSPGQSLPDVNGYSFSLYFEEGQGLDISKAYSYSGRPAFAPNDHILVESGGRPLFGSLPAGSNLDPGCGPSGGPSLSVMSMQETNEANISKPRFYVQNQGDTTVPGFILRYRFTVEGGKRPVLESWYVPGCATRLESLGGAEYAMVADCSKVPVAPGQVVPNRSGFVVGLHYPDWSAWDRGNDSSNPAQDTFAPSSTITLSTAQVSSTVLPAVDTTTSANAPALAWQNTLGGPHGDYVEDMFEAQNGGFVVAGWTSSYGATPGTYDDAWLTKTDAFGAEVWRKTFGGELYERFTSVRPTSDSGIIATGFTTVEGTGQDILMVKTDGAGQVVFQKNFGGAEFESGAVVRETRDGGFIVAGDVRSPMGGSAADIVLLRTDAQGNQVWLKRFGNATTWKTGNSVAETCDGGFVVAAEDNGQGVLLAVDSAGSLKWNQPIAAGIAKTVVATPDNGFLVLGDGGTGAANRDLWLAKTSSAGQVLWTRALGGASQDMAKDLRPTREGNYLVLAWQVTPGSGPTYPWVAEIDDTGAPLWTKTVGDGAFRVGSTAISTPHGTVVAGYTGGTNSDGWFANLGTARLTDVVLPPTFSYCDADCQDQPLPVVYACPASDPNCTPTQSTTVLFSVNGRRIDSHYLAVQNANDLTWPSLRRLDRGGGEITPSGYGLIARRVPGIILRSDAPLLLTRRHIPAVMGGTTHLEYRAQGIADADLDTLFFRAAEDDAGDTGYSLADRSVPVVRQEKLIAGLTTNHPRISYLPAELARLYADGHVSFGDGVMTVNTTYGLGSSAIHELAHEYAHELFDVTNPAYQGWINCLSEGHADAMSMLIGTMPEADLGPVHLSGINFANNCQSVTDPHDIGNCYFWHLKQAGVLDTAFLNRFYHPQRRTQFDTCAMSNINTANWLVVVFSESAERDMAAVVTGMNIPNAGSYEAAKAALGL